jgi:hypothetical protein
MGYKFQVYAWEKDLYGEYGGYIYNLKWEGESFFKALFTAWRFKKQGIRSVKIEWRAV